MLKTFDDLVCFLIQFICFELVMLVFIAVVLLVSFQCIKDKKKELGLFGEGFNNSIERAGDLVICCSFMQPFINELNKMY